MKSMKIAAGILLSLVLFSSCKKDKPDERIYARWKITEYYLDGQPAFDTIVKYLDGYEYEIMEIKGYGSQSYCGCDATVRTYDDGVGGNPEYSNINSETITTYALRLFHIPPPSCDSNSASVTCWGFPNSWKYSFYNNSVMEWEWLGQSVPSHTHKIIFSKI